MNKGTFAIVQLATAAVSALICFTNVHAADPDSFHIGGVVSLSGTYGMFGEDMRRGVEIAIDQRGGKVLD